MKNYEQYYKLEEAIYKAKHNTDDLEVAMKKELGFGCCISDKKGAYNVLVQKKFMTDDIWYTLTTTISEDEIYKVRGKPIRLDDVMVALGDGYVDEMTRIEDGVLYFKFDSGEPAFSWILREALGQQTDSTKESLIKLLVK